MPVEVASILSMPFPSFMSRFGKADTSIVEDMAGFSAETIHNEGQIFIAETDRRPDTTILSSQPLHHRDSVTSIMTASTESSLTTTNSTFDSPLIPDASPSSSPESASSNLPILPFRTVMGKDATTEAAPCQATQLKEVSKDAVAKPEAVVETTRNVKNLSLNMGVVVLPRPSTSHGFESSEAFSAPPSPLKDTPRTGRKKPTNLTIRTPGFQQQTFSRTLDVPPTPSSRPSLHHIQSSPSLGFLASPGKPPPQGLFLQLPAPSSVYSGSSAESSNTSQSTNGNLPEVREEDEFHPQRSQETQEKGYPKGPVLIYDTGVYLYLEPTADEASGFDTVINVAKEINCPLDLDVSRADVAEPKTAISELSFKSAWEWPRPTDLETPTTPRQGAFSQTKQPEYLHVPWDHNSEILEDLYTLCRLIDERVQAGKKVLIHCQLGVSRSASLVIAYGLFKGYQPDFHSMYMTVKERSQWVGPNMSLIYQLTDFRSKVVKGVYGDHSYNPSPSWWKMPTVESPSMDTSIATREMWEEIPKCISTSGEAPGSSTPALLPRANVWGPMRLNKALPPVPLFPKDDPINVVTSDNAAPVLDNVPTKFPRPGASPNFTAPTDSSSPPRSLSPRPLPFREQFEAVVETVPSPLKPSRTPRLGVWAVSPKMDLALHDVPGSPTLLSPRAAEFMASPFGITSAGDLAVPTKDLPLPQQELASTSQEKTDRLSTAVDPRSPHQQGEPQDIFRHIDGFL
ncbi:hypothetical protein A1O1_01031 [Capronia coronata CBS 617.96]|uniref:protein-tyrosine-phosphatase n=1 Tax=Capronia coronata CBS 617.96 TaxID=1182541 RepID=W9Z2W8_9EURO|nr:uncharacterized protein A1O1_01031 [Capronia coronata CBS 617.96]EXJ95906.1 hypothetical protein A1O1_01031 [Capronia coronata CBS 617.96]